MDLENVMDVFISDNYIRHTQNILNIPFFKNPYSEFTKTTLQHYNTKQKHACK
jgi:hypothetical protein